MTTTLRLNPAGIAAWARTAEAEALLKRVGDDIAADAAAAAPKRTGEGAASIHAETGTDTDGPYVLVSWDKTHFYMAFHELGTSRQSATPFLRPAAQKHRRY